MTPSSKVVLVTFSILTKFDNNILIDSVFPLQQQQAPPINSISTAAVTSTNSISPNPTAATATLPDQKQIQGKILKFYIFELL